LDTDTKSFIPAHSTAPIKAVSKIVN